VLFSLSELTAAYLLAAAIFQGQLSLWETCTYSLRRRVVEPFEIGVTVMLYEFCVKMFNSRLGRGTPNLRHDRILL